MKKLKKISPVYWYYFIVRQRGSANSLALGVAIGLFIGFLIPMGGQMVFALSFALIFRASKIMALGCTWVTNPYTVPFIYPAQCYLGSILMGSPLNFQKITMVFKIFFQNPNWDSFMKIGQDFILPFFIGGFSIGVVSAFLGYFTAYGMIESYRSRRKKKLNRRLSSVAR